eukprot:426600-Amphidinium_carterae.1
MSGTLTAKTLGTEEEVPPQTTSSSEAEEEQHHLLERDREREGNVEHKTVDLHQQPLGRDRSSKISPDRVSG